MHGEPTEKKLQDGELITLDFGGVVDGYCGDMTRTIGLGKISQRQRDIYNIVLQSQLAGLDAVRAGVSSRFVDSVCRSIIDHAGLGKYFIHGTGHGVGKQVHEEPRVNLSTDSVLTSGLAITIEPGIYIENEIGVRIEDLVIVDECGIINLTKSPKELLIL
jgi:Xaa-Pro aminopeptidase